jgi:hypothetical protein
VHDHATTPIYAAYVAGTHRNHCTPPALQPPLDVQKQSRQIPPYLLVAIHEISNAVTHVEPNRDLTLSPTCTSSQDFPYRYNYPCKSVPARMYLQTFQFNMRHGV